MACVFGQGAEATAQASATTTYAYHYPYNTPELIEDHFIVLESGVDGIRGWYYGTSDEFDAAREGYLPGFFVAPLTGLELTDDAIAFTLHRPSRFFAAPIPLQYRSAADVPPGLLDEWNVPLTTDSRQYTGTLRGGEISLEVPGSPRVFRTGT
jgi:hypothetical protein